MQALSAPDGLLRLLPDARHAKLVITSVLSSGQFLVLPSIVVSRGAAFSVRYQVSCAAISILEHSVSECLLHVPAASLDFLFRDLAVKKPRKMDAVLVKLFDLFQSEWKWSARKRSEILADYARRTAKQLVRKRPMCVEGGGEVELAWKEILAESDSDRNDDVAELDEMTSMFLDMDQAAVEDGPTTQAEDLM